MSFPELYVALFRRRYGDYQHWGLYIDNDPENLVFEVTGEHPSFECHIETCPLPGANGRLLPLAVCRCLSNNNIDTVNRVAATVMVYNETVEWDCQEYVLDMLDALEEECVLDRDDEDYQ